jgi:hypothetical protein
MRYLYFIILVLLLASVVVFAVQNNEVVTLHFLDRSISCSMPLLVAAVYVLGMLTRTDDDCTSDAKGQYAKITRQLGTSIAPCHIKPALPASRLHLSTVLFESRDVPPPRTPSMERRARCDIGKEANPQAN